MRKYSHSDIHFLWETNRWDGFLSGYGILDGKDVYLECFTESHTSPFIRKYYIYSLNQEQCNKWREDWNKFQRWIGVHCDLNSDGTRKPYIRPHHNYESNAKEYYGESFEPRNKREYLNSQILGYFIWNHNEN